MSLGFALRVRIIESRLSVFLVICLIFLWAFVCVRPFLLESGRRKLDGFENQLPENGRVLEILLVFCLLSVLLINYPSVFGLILIAYPIFLALYTVLFLVVAKSNGSSK